MCSPANSRETAKKLPWKFVVLGVVLGAVLLAVVAIAAYYILYIKYSVIFVRGKLELAPCAYCAVDLKERGGPA